MSCAEERDRIVRLAVVCNLVAAASAGAEREHGIDVRRCLVLCTEEPLATTPRSEGRLSIASLGMMTPTSRPFGHLHMIWLLVLLTEALAPSPSCERCWLAASCFLTTLANMNLSCQSMLSAARSRFISLCVIGTTHTALENAREKVHWYVLLLSMVFAESRKRTHRNAERWGSGTVAKLAPTT